MVDVGSKSESERSARASGYVEVGSEVTKLISANELKKGDVLSVAQLAGIMAAKRTPELIPLCHNLNLTQVKVELKLNPEKFRVEIAAEAKCQGRTGVEMEALTAVSVAALVVYDMVKSAAPARSLKICDIKLLEKRGGKSDFVREE